MLARIKAMLLRCRKNGGDCPCGTECRAESEQSRQSVFAATVPIQKVVPDPALVKPNWKRPRPPVEGYELVVHHTGDGWALAWENDDGDVIDDETTGEASWPFIDDWATASDWKRIGIEVV